MDEVVTALVEPQGPVGTITGHIYTEGDGIASSYASLAPNGHWVSIPERFKVVYIG